MINGKACPVGRVVRINGKGGHDCIKGAPHFDKEGSVCGNDGKSNQAYCSYQVGDKACAYCSSTENNKHDSGSGKSSGNGFGSLSLSLSLSLCVCVCVCVVVVVVVFYVYTSVHNHTNATILI